MKTISMTLFKLATIILFVEAMFLYSCSKKDDEKAQYTLSISISPYGAGSVIKEPDKDSYDDGEVVYLNIIATDACEFNHWEGDLSGNNNPANIQMDSNKNITAVFGKIKTFGGADTDIGNSIQQTSDGGYIITGLTKSFGIEGTVDVYLIKTDSHCNQSWYKSFGGSSSDGGNSVQQTTDGGYIITGYNSSHPVYSLLDDVYLIKTDLQGNLLWHKKIGNDDTDQGYWVQQTIEGGYVIIGFTWSYDSNSRDVYLLKTDSQGNLEWYNTFGGSENDEGYCVQQTTDGGYVITGYTKSYGAGYFDIYLIKTDSQGNKEWIKTFGGTDTDIGYSIQQTSDGGYIITGQTNSYENNKEKVYLIKTDSKGNQNWYRTFDGLGSSIGKSIQQTFDGGYIIAGTTWDSSTIRASVYLIKTNSEGIQSWYKTFGGTDDYKGNSVRQTSDGGYIITGSIQKYNGGGFDVIIIKTDSEGNME